MILSLTWAGPYQQLLLLLLLSLDPSIFASLSSVNWFHLIFKLTWRQFVQSESGTTSPFGCHCFDSGKYSSSLCKLLKLSPHFFLIKCLPCVKTIYFSSHGSISKCETLFLEKEVQYIEFSRCSKLYSFKRFHVLSNFYNLINELGDYLQPKIAKSPTTWSSLLEKVKITPQGILMVSKHYIFHFKCVFYLLIFDLENGIRP